MTNEARMTNVEEKYSATVALEILAHHSCLDILSSLGISSFVITTPALCAGLPTPHLLAERAS